MRVRQQALLLLADVLHRRENLASAITEGIAESLQNLLSDEDALVRERAAKVLCNIARKWIVIIFCCFENFIIQFRAFPWQTSIPEVGHHFFSL